MTATTETKLSALRNLMQAANLDYYLVPSSDPHQSEYVPACWQRRQYISEFTGSAGLAVIGKEAAYLWTDGRYFSQAQQQLNPDYWQLMRQGIDLALPAWLSEQSQPLQIGVDPSCITQQEAKQLQTAIAKNGGSIQWISHNLIDQIWSDQPSLPIHPAVIYPVEYAGMETTDKLKIIRQKMERKECRSLAVNRLDSIAWLLNIRGSDIDYNPLCISYLIITMDTAWWFINPQKVSNELQTYLQEQTVFCRNYEDYFPTLSELTGPIWIDPSAASYANLQAVGETEIFHAPCPLYGTKAVKNRTEIECFRQAHVQDGLALCDFFYWLEQQPEKSVTELAATDYLLQSRKKQPLFQQESFTTISGYGPNGAIIHYQPNEKSNRSIDRDSIFLLDSGGQYLGGTTDVTRCVHLGEPTEAQRRHYTLVLKSHLALRRAIFPQGTFGENLDGIARQPLWREGLDFAHGTGHGVGSYLCVHEGPQRIGRGATHTPLQQGMVLSNEPGLYFEGEYGIRIENLCLITDYVPPADSLIREQMLCFNDLTLFPYEKKLMDTSILTRGEIRAINYYHTMVYSQLSPKIKDLDVQHWLAEKTNPIEVH